MNDRYLARFTRFLGPRDGALRTACRRLAMAANCLRHGATLSFKGDSIDVSKGSRTIRIATKHFPYASDMARYFEDYFGSVTAVAEKNRLVVDYSQPKLHRYAASGLEFELSSFAEEESAIDGYSRWYKPKPGDTVFDLGAYCGVSTYYFAQMVGPSGKVYAFEPDPLNFPLLERNIARHHLANVIPLQVAISDSPGFADFLAEASLGSSLAAHSSRGPEVAVSRVRTITFKEACEMYGVPAFVKIDIEGAEAAVLSAASEFLKSTPIHFALDTNHVVNGELSNRAVEEIFRACNYEVESSADSGFMTTWARPAGKIKTAA